MEKRIHKIIFDELDSADKTFPKLFKITLYFAMLSFPFPLVSSKLQL